MRKRHILAGAFGGVLVLSYSLIPSFGIRYYRHWKNKRNGKKKVLYLTFDDGPSKEYTGHLLELLGQYDIKAAFFVVAEFAKEHPDIILRMKKEGHLIGIHSVHHQNALFRGSRFVHSDLKESIETLEHMGCRVCYYRPPWGHLNLFTLFWVRKMNLKLVFWDVMAKDWSGRETKDTIKEKLLSCVYPGAVICLHDGRGEEGAPGRTLLALKEVLPVLLKQGYSFERMDTYE